MAFFKRRTSGKTIKRESRLRVEKLEGETTPTLLLTELRVMRRKGRPRWIINFTAKVDGDVYPMTLAFSQEITVEKTGIVLN